MSAPARTTPFVNKTGVVNFRNVRKISFTGQTKVHSQVNVIAQ